MRILLIDETSAAAMELAGALRRENYAVDMASSPDDALYKVAINTYSLVLLDADLQSGAGLTLCRNLRAQGFQGSVMMLAAQDNVSQRIQGLDAGADEFLTRTCDPREFFARLRSLARRSPVRMADCIEIRDLRIDTTRRDVRRAGVRIALTGKEYVILEYLARRKEELVTRTDLSEHAWDESYDPFSNLIEVYMLRLRRKIDAPFSHKLLHTLRGEGYKLTEGALAA